MKTYLKILGLFLLVLFMFGCNIPSINKIDKEEKHSTLNINISGKRGWNIAKYTVEAKKDQALINKEFFTNDTMSLTLAVGLWEITVYAKDTSDNILYSGKSSVNLTEQGVEVTIILLQNAGNCKLTINNEANYTIVSGKPGFLQKITATAKRDGFTDIVKEINNFGDSIVFTDLVSGDWDFVLEGKALKLNANYSQVANEYETYLSTTVKKTVNSGKINNYVVGIQNQVKVTPVIASVPSGSVISGTTISLSCDTATTSIKYQKNTDTTADYSTPISITGNAGDVIKLKVYALKDGMVNSSINELTYQIVANTVTPDPQISPIGGTYQTSVNVTLSCTDTAAVIYYTTDNSTPTESSTQYSSAITINATTTIKALAKSTGKLASQVVSETYTIASTKVSTPVILPVSGDYDTSTDFTIISGTTGADIYYTTNGDTPTKDSTKYTGGFKLTKGTKTIKAIASKDGFIDSDVKSESYNITDVFSGIIIYIEKPDGWSNVWIWYDKDSNAVWETTALASPPGDMVNYRTGWYKKEIANTASVTFLFNDGTWVKKLQNAGKDFVATKTVWINKTGVMQDTDPIAPQKPTISGLPAGSNFSTATVNVTLSVSGTNISKCVYTLDGSAPDTSLTSINFTDNTTITIGSDMTTDQTKTLKMYALNNVGSSYIEYVFTKVKQQNIISTMKLGAIYSPTKTTFKIWSPDYTDVKVKVDGVTYTCSKIADFDGYTDIYAVDVNGDLKLKEYQFLINGKAVRDPYGVMVKPGQNINIVMDMGNILPDGGWASLPTLTNREDSIIYEIHVRDFTIDSSSGVPDAKKGKFGGMTYTGATYQGKKTGIDHLKELGVTHVQVLPVYDFATGMYNWGYDPYNYNVPEDLYSETPLDYENRVKEFKNMVNEFHKNGIRVVMDVVYNHTYGDEMFKDITTKYFDGLNLSGCGNSIDTGKPMVSRFIRDSLEYWMKEYNIDGFRFDLVGIFYYDEYKKWGEYLNSVDPTRNLLMYGEPWNGYATDPNESGKVRMGKCPAIATGHVGVFNGKYREDIKGNNDGTTRGFMFNGTAVSWNGAIAVGMRGSVTAAKTTNVLANDWDSMFAYDPEQSINYISAHDNYCLWDKIKHSGEDNDYGKQVLKFGMGMILTSQGIPFIHGGDEILRTKVANGIWTYAHNSYNAPDDYNKIKWDWKVTNEAVFNYHRDLIALRKAHAGLRLTNWDEIKTRMKTEMKVAPVGVNVDTNSSLPDKVVVSYLDEDNNLTNGYELAVVYNPGSNFDITLPSGTWNKIFDVSGAVNKTDKTCEGTAVTMFSKQ
ncbi:MAG: hypothetical protein A2086_01625 [Spirochaetes bacterium GWD1_27_9]|nr:MAG: hypothetical protein A2Z98_15485 [Spirochaetes bacterium GWB1_27_13]OHD28049.1 MAG: hypothetical protein A2Y34_02585 [Spirochaetes bacterium GWC1_27_15]OHD41774.1 MAG: hypothetical protein A2086_01625 [Spirochaetes bacterium GWD1_27_9]